MPIVSVIIPVYNAGRYIARCARSLYEQTLREIEYIFVNDASTDNSVEVLMSVMEHYPNRCKQTIILNNDCNSGPSYSRNKGLEIASGEYIIFCDADDAVDSEAYENMLNTAYSTNADMVACGVVVEKKNKRVELLFEDGFSLSLLSLTTRLDYKRLEGALYSSLNNKLVRRSCYIDNNINFDNRLKMWDDFYVTFRLRYYCNLDTIINEPYYHYHIVNPTSITSSNVLEKSNSQIECARLIELFINGKPDKNKYDNIVSFIKFHSKDLLFTSDYIDKWITIFNETHINVYNFLDFYGLARTMRYLLVIVFGKFGWKLLTGYSKLKRFFK